MTAIISTLQYENSRIPASDYLLIDWISAPNIISLDLIDSLEFHLKTAFVRISDPDASSFLRYDGTTLIGVGNKYRIGQRVRIVDGRTLSDPSPFSHVSIFYGKIKEMRLGTSDFGPTIELQLEDHMSELRDIDIDSGTFNSFSNLNTIQALQGVVVNYRIGGRFNNLLAEAINIGTLNLVGMDGGTFQSTVNKNFASSSYKALDVIEMIASEAVWASGTYNIDFYLSDNGEFLIFEPFTLPSEPLVDGLTFVYGGPLSGGDSSALGNFRMPILPESTLPHSIREVANKINVYGQSPAFASVFDTDSINIFGTRTKIINDPSALTDNDALFVAQSEFDKLSHPTLRGNIVTLGYPMFKTVGSQLRPLRISNMVHVYYKTYAISEKFQVYEIRYSEPSRKAIIELVKPGSGAPDITPAYRQFIDLSKKVKALTQMARGAGVGLPPGSVAGNSTIVDRSYDIFSSAYNEMFGNNPTASEIADNAFLYALSLELLKTLPHDRLINLDNDLLALFDNNFISNKLSDIVDRLSDNRIKGISYTADPGGVIGYGPQTTPNTAFSLDFLDKTLSDNTQDLRDYRVSLGLTPYKSANNSINITEENFPLYWPVNDAINIGFHFNGLFSPGENPGSYIGHNGVDFPCAIGTTVRSAEKGTITDLSATSLPQVGKYIEITHTITTIIGNISVKTRYLHLSSIAGGLNIGSNVTRSQVIGASGDTGLSTGPHLHFDLMHTFPTQTPLTNGYGGRVNPEPHLVKNGL